MQTSLLKRRTSIFRSNDCRWKSAQATRYFETNQASPFPLQILFPSGATLYYGRVSPNDIPAVVNQTILNGKIVAGLLRGGNNIVRDELRKDSTQVSDKTCNKKGKTLLDW